MPTGLDQADPHSVGEAWLHPVEVDLLCAYAEIRPPFPLRVRSPGATLYERRSVHSRARADLAARGLADGRGPRGVAADLVHLLRDGVGALDMLVARRGRAVGSVLLAKRDEALLVTQARDGDQRVRLLALSLHDAVEAMVRMVPELPAAMAPPFSLPRAAVAGVRRDLMAAAGRVVGPDEVDRLLSAHGLDEQSARRMVSYLQPVLGNGQAGLAVRQGFADAWTRSGDEVRWLDCERGRFRLGPGEWTSVNPFDREDLRAELRGLARELWY